MRRNPVPADELSTSQARRVALAAQGFGHIRRPNGQPGTRSILRVVNQLQLLQLDSVNVLIRSHYLPVFSRLGGYPIAILDRLAWSSQRRLIEYWGHAACLMPLDLHPLLRWRMAEAHRDAWGGLRRLAVERPDFVARIRAELAEHGPVTAGELETIIEHEVDRPTGPWWGWRETKAALEWLLWTGEVTAASRRNFERVYDLTSKVVPASILKLPTPEPADAHRELIRRAAVALGVGTESDLRDYFRLTPAQGRAAITDLVDAGELLPVSVAGWQQLWYLHKDAQIPRRIAAAAVLSPFDSLIWYRTRAERLWNFRYRLEFYTPQPCRVFGYYVLPFLLDEHLVARIDVKADRQASALLVRAAYLEEGANPTEVAPALSDQVKNLAHWLDLAQIHVTPQGNLAQQLAKFL